MKTENSNVVGLTSLLDKYIKGIEPESNIGSELTYRLPDEFSQVFGKMLEDVERNIKALGFSEFGISVSSLEEVFMKIGAENVEPNVMSITRASAFDNDSSSSSQQSHVGDEEIYLKRAKQIPNFGVRQKREKFSKEDEKAKRLPSIKGQEHIYLNPDDSVLSLKSKETSLKSREKTVEPKPITTLVRIESFGSKLNEHFARHFD